MSGLPVHVRAARTFASIFQTPPSHGAVAPGRVNLIGEHTDYNDGFVLPMAIERETACVGARTADGQVHVHSGATHAGTSFALRDLGPGGPPWANYIRGVVAGFQRLGVRIDGLRLAIESDVPLGGGLSSSAALEVAAATLLETLTGITLDPMSKARLCRQAEHDFAGVPCGLMDQAVVVLARQGHALLLDCRSGDVEHVPMADPSGAVLIINTNIRHELATGEYARRRSDCEEAARQLGVPSLRDATADQIASATLPPTLARRARHVVTENSRTIGAVAALRAGDWREMGRLMYQSHASLRDDYDVSCPELDIVVDLAAALGETGGVWGCRMTGGGFGGCAVALVDARTVAAISRHLADAYRARTQLEATIFATRPAAGARPIATFT
jgi:galactokinase